MGIEIIANSASNCSLELLIKLGSFTLEMAVLKAFLFNLL